MKTGTITIKLAGNGVIILAQLNDGAKHSRKMLVATNDTDAQARLAEVVADIFSASVTATTGESA